MKKNLEERVERILTGYHSEVEPGEESMMFDEDMDCLKYCTVGEECREMKHRLKKDNELVEKTIFLKDYWADGNNCSLRLLMESDKDAYMAVNKENSDIEVAYSMPEFIEAMWKSAMEEEITLAVLEKKCGIFIGYIDIQHIEREKPELGIELVKEYQGKGIGTEAIGVLLNSLKGTVDEKQVFIANARIDNVASQRMLEKLGAVKCGTDDGTFVKVIKSIASEMGEEDFEKYRLQCKDEGIDFEEMCSEGKVVAYELKIANVRKSF